METVICFRPVNRAELNLIAASDFREWPPRLPEQPIFYPVTNENYAVRINEWNVKQYGAGYVTRFEVRTQFMERFAIHCVGDKDSTEWWIPAEHLAELNANIVGRIEVIGEYHALEKR